MSELSHDEKFSEWNRLANIGWINMSVDDLKATLEALRELLVRDAQWVEKWKAALDLLDGPNERAAAAQARAEKLAGLLKQSYRQHDWVDEDCWYSCPKADDYCGDKPRDVCLCGADAWNAHVDAALAAPVDGVAGEDER